VLPFTGLNFPNGVAVDAAGNLYVTDAGNNRVLKLPVQ
jgi:serine/threonine-protein kinase